MAKYKTAFGLVRVSTKGQSIESQKEKLSEIAKEMGYEIIDNREGFNFFSEKITGYDEPDYDRDSIIQLQQQILIRKPKAIFCLELSRLTRRAIKVSHYIDMLSIQPGIPMYFADYKIWTLVEDKKVGKYRTNDDGIMTLYGAALSVEKERERIIERTTRGRDSNARKGLYVGHLSDGYKCVSIRGEKHIEIDKERAEIVKLVFDLYTNKGYSTGQIRDYLISKGIPTTNRYRLEHPDDFLGYSSEYKDRDGNVFNRNDSLWDDSGVSRILTNEWYIGKRKYNDVVYSVKPIIDTELWERTQERLKTYRLDVGTARNPYLLTGRLFCGKCGRKLYAHSDGYSNMYYCSSKEFGTITKCGLKWVRIENLDSIVLSIVKHRAFNDTIQNNENELTDFFDVKGSELDEINKLIVTYQNLMTRSDVEIEKINKKIQYYIQKQGENLGNEVLANNYAQQIQVELENIETVKTQKEDYHQKAEKSRRMKKLLLSVKDKLTDIASLSDFERAKKLIKTTVRKIILYNPDKRTTVIKIHYVNNKTDTAIYCPQRLGKSFIFLSRDDEQLQFDDRVNAITFDGWYLAVGNNQEYLFREGVNSSAIISLDDELSFGEWDTPTNRDNYRKAVEKKVQQGEIQDSDKQYYYEAYDKAVRDGLVWKNIDDAVRYFNKNGAEVYHNCISVADYVERKRKDTLKVYDYNDLLPLSEKGELRKERHRRWYAEKYNNGKPFFTPYVVKDKSYEEICKERKHLYNRKYKILQNKHLTESEKAKQIDKVLAMLEALKYQVKYLPTNKRGADLKEKYSEKATGPIK